jgi:Ras-related protein Rab-18
LQVGTKLDKAETSRAVSVEEGEALAAAHAAHFCEASAKTTENVRKPFVEVVDMIVSNPALLSGKGRGRTAGTVDVGTGGEGEGYLAGCSC